MGKQIQTRVRVRPEARHLWDAIREAMGWTFAEAAVRVARHFCEQHGIPANSTGNNRHPAITKRDEFGKR